MIEEIRGRMADLESTDNETLHWAPHHIRANAVPYIAALLEHIDKGADEHKATTGFLVGGLVIICFFSGLFIGFAC